MFDLCVSPTLMPNKTFHALRDCTSISEIVHPHLWDCIHISFSTQLMRHQCTMGWCGSMEVSGVKSNINSSKNTAIYKIKFKWTSPQKKSENWPKKQRLGDFLSTYTGESIIPLYTYWGFFNSLVYYTGDLFIQENHTAQSAHSAMHCSMHHITYVWPRYNYKLTTPIYIMKCIRETSYSMRS